MTGPLKLQREREKNDHEHFFIFNPLPRQYNSSLNFFFSSDQRLVGQCPVQPSCRRHEVPGWKTDCAYHWTVLYLPADLLYNRQEESMFVQTTESSP